MSNWILVDDGYYNSPAAGDISKLVATVGNNGSAYLYAFDAVNITASNIWVQAFDSLTLPANGTAPLLQLQISANSQASLSKPLPLHRWVFKNGIFFASSSTPGSLTVSVSKTMMLYAYFTV